MKEYTVGQLTKLIGVTVRTLQHYDNIGLLPASGRSANGRRFYTQADLYKLEQIQFYKFLGFSLEHIKEKLVSDPSVGQLQTVLEEHRELVFHKIEQLHTVRMSVDAALMATKMGEYPPPRHITEMIQALNQASFFEWSPTILEEYDNQFLETIMKRPEEIHILYHQWKAVSIKAVMLKEMGVDAADDAAQQVAAEFWEMIMGASQGRREVFQVFNEFNNGRDKWGTGEGKLAEESEEYLTHALGIYIEKNQIEVPDFIAEQGE